MHYSLLWLESSAYQAINVNECVNSAFPVLVRSKEDRVNIDCLTLLAEHGVGTELLALGSYQSYSARFALYC